MRQDELEADQDRRSQRSELPSRLPARHEVDSDRGEHEHDLQHALDQMQIGITGPVLLPVPDREWRMSAELELDRPVVENVRGVERARLEQQDREGGGRCDEETTCKSQFF